MTIKSRPPQDHYVVVGQFAFKIDPLTIRAVELCPTNPRRTPLVLLLLALVFHLVDSGDLGTVQKQCGMPSSKQNCGSV